MAQAKRRFLVDEKGRKRAVVLPIREYQDLLEDLEDLAVIAERREEPAEPLEVVKKRLEEKWFTDEGKRCFRLQHMEVPPTTRALAEALQRRGIDDKARVA